MEQSPDDLRRQLLFEALGHPPYFARLRDPRRRLSSLEWASYPELHRNKYFVVIEHELDRDEEHPGIWLRPILTLPAEFSHLDSVVTDEGELQAQWLLTRLAHLRIPVWLNLDWCVVQQVHSVN